MSKVYMTPLICLVQCMTSDLTGEVHFGFQIDLDRISR